MLHAFRPLLPLLALVALLCVACAPPTPPTPPPTADAWGAGPSPDAPPTFVGNETCASCHPTEMASHQKTRHFATLRPATTASLGPLAPALGPLPGGAILRAAAGSLVLDAIAPATGERRSIPLQLALGSGKFGITFLALMGTSAAEIHQSYFPRDRRWHPTPGQESLPTGQIGRVFGEEEARQCISCHAVHVPEQQLQPELKDFGVGCESCHGPGSRHVAAQKSQTKLPNAGLVPLVGAGGKQLNQVCGRCHRTAETVAGMDATAKASTQRFQPYGLARSKCFQASGDKLTCITCHEPHQDAVTDPKHYEAVCLSCHTAPKTVCPVNPKEKCISCHMPPKAVFGHFQMADHFIRTR